MNQVTNTIKNVIDLTWPLVIISIVVLGLIILTIILGKKRVHNN